MSYLELALWFTAFAGVSAAVLTLLARRSSPAVGGHLAAVGVTVAVLVVLTAVFDTLMIAADLFYYAPEMLVGIHIGLAPIEDFSYPLAGALLLPSVWFLLRSRRTRNESAREDPA